MTVKIVKLIEDAVIPTRQTEGSAGYDLYLPKETLILPGRHTYRLGIALEIPSGYGAVIRPKSGHSSKGIPSANAIREDADVLHGLIDSDYRGEIGVTIYSKASHIFTVNKWTKIAQMTFQKFKDVDFVEVDELSETKRGTKGFGEADKEH